jgi:hypothetical protein
MCPQSWRQLVESGTGLLWMICVEKVIQPNSSDDESFVGGADDHLPKQELPLGGDTDFSVTVKRRCGGIR